MSVALYVIGILAAIVAGTILLYMLFNRAGEKGVMEEAALMHEQNVEKGYLGAPEELQKYIGAEGVALTVLRPAGKIKIGEEIIDAVSYNDFIDEGSPIKVLKYENAQLYVLKN